MHWSVKELIGDILPLTQINVAKIKMVSNKL